MYSLNFWIMKKIELLVLLLPTIKLVKKSRNSLHKITYRQLNSSKREESTYKKRKWVLLKCQILPNLMNIKIPLQPKIARIVGPFSLGLNFLIVFWLQKGSLTPWSFAKEWPECNEHVEPTDDCSTTKISNLPARPHERVSTFPVRAPFPITKSLQ